MGNALSSPGYLSLTILQIGDDHRADDYLSVLEDKLPVLGASNEIVDVISQKWFQDKNFNEVVKLATI